MEQRTHETRHRRRLRSPGHTSDIDLAGRDGLEEILRLVLDGLQRDPDLFEVLYKRLDKLFIAARIDIADAQLNAPIGRNLRGNLVQEFVRLVEIADRIFPSPRAISRACGRNDIIGRQAHTAIDALADILPIDGKRQGASELRISQMFILHIEREIDQLELGHLDQMIAGAHLIRGFRLPALSNR